MDWPHFLGSYLLTKQDGSLSNKSRLTHTKQSLGSHNAANGSRNGRRKGQGTIVRSPPSCCLWLPYFPYSLFKIKLGIHFLYHRSGRHDHPQYPEPHLLQSTGLTSELTVPIGHASQWALGTMVSATNPWARPPELATNFSAYYLWLWTKDFTLLCLQFFLLQKWNSNNRS